MCNASLFDKRCLQERLDSDEWMALKHLPQIRKDLFMETVDIFQQNFGGRWTGIKFFFDAPPDGEHFFTEDTRFCEAISRSWSSNHFLTRESVNCPGANYVFRWEDHIEEKLIDNLHSEKNIPMDNAVSIVHGLPRMMAAPAAIGLNCGETPDLLVAYVQPAQIMNLIYKYQKNFGKELTVALNSFASVCANVAVKTYLYKKICISFGCEDARMYGGISRDRLVVGIPYALAQRLA